MGYAKRYSASVTTAADGSATAYIGTGDPITGRLVNLIYTKDVTAPYDNGVDFTITAEATGQTLWTESNVNASKTVCPRQATHATDGTASLYAAEGEPVEGYLVLAQDRIKIVVASGGDTKVGTFTAVVE
jgi:hypothetical protein